MAGLSSVVIIIVTWDDTVTVQIDMVTAEEFRSLFGLEPKTGNFRKKSSLTIESHIWQCARRGRPLIFSQNDEA